ncbi:hypothetical protein BPO_p0071 (plasmid) [Bergeyella porcorum]|uniref:Uncharacterized protein n=1 Tax=Bergeyella porcorum TaxID=1735111 RepID=A0AAU0F316_9FLAO
MNYEENISMDLALGIIIFLINSCAREEGIPVKADFSITVVNNDYSVSCSGTN